MSTSGRSGSSLSVAWSVTSSTQFMHGVPSHTLVTRTHTATMSYSTIDKEAQPIVADAPTYSKKILAGAVAIAFVIGAAAATATSTATVSTSTYLKTNTGVAQTYAFSVYKSDQTYDKCDEKCISSIIGDDGGASIGDPQQMPCLTSYDMVKQMAGDMKKAGATDGSTAWFHYINGVWQCEHKSYNTKLGFYYDYAHWDPSQDPTSDGCGVVLLGDVSTTKDSGSSKTTDYHWHIKDCDSKRMCVCQGSSDPVWHDKS